MPVPDRSLQQRMDAIAVANHVRTCRAQLKRDVKAGRREARDVILDPPEWARTMPVLDLLLAVPKVGRVKAAKMLVAGRVSPYKTLGGATSRQRAELVAILGAASSGHYGPDYAAAARRAGQGL